MPDKNFIDFDLAQQGEISRLAEFLGELRVLGRPFTSERIGSKCRVFIQA